MKAVPAPKWTTTKWFNSHRPLDVTDFKGKILVVYAFQMLCPACVTHGIPQASKVYSAFGGKDVEVVGLHTVFEHHEAMGPASLEAFLHEFRVEFPVGVDAPDDNGHPRPQTMRKYRMQGTPTIVLIDRAGNIRKQIFGIYDDLLLGADIARLSMEPTPGEAGDTEFDGAAEKVSASSREENVGDCAPERCEVASSS